MQLQSTYLAYYLLLAHQEVLCRKQNAVIVSRLVEGQTQSIKLQEQIEENTPSENTLLPATCTGIQNKIRTPQETK